MAEHFILEIASIILLGVAAQWLAWRLRLPGILLLLLFGFIAGPVLGILDPDALLGDLLFPFVSVSVGIILFEGGLSLRMADWRQAGSVIRRLITVGALVTWALSIVAALLFLDLSLPLVLQFTAILVVTGPTVVTPLLRFVRPIGRVGPILRWEGILIDPVGATLALLVFEAIRIANVQQAALNSLLDIGETIVVGSVGGYVGARLLLLVMKRGWIPESLQNPLILGSVIGIFAVSNELQAESGLLATTVMGIVLANQREVVLRHVVEFKENLGLLLLSALFILLAARVNIEQLQDIGPGSLLFLAAMILVVRPLSVAVSTWGSTLTWRERLFMAWMAPRGIVAAAISSIFALRLAEEGFAQAELLVPLAFVVIVGTCLVYGLTSLPLAKRLGLARPSPEGALLVGGHGWALAIGQALKAASQPVLVIDTNYDNVTAARLAGLDAIHGDVLLDDIESRPEYQVVGHLLALTSNDEVNALAALHFEDTFGHDYVYQLPAHKKNRPDEDALPQTLLGRLLFAPQADFQWLTRQFEAGATVKATKITDTFKFADYQAQYGEGALPLFAIDNATGSLYVATVDKPLAPKPGQTVISLIEASHVSETTARPLMAEALP